MAEYIASYDTSLQSNAATTNRNGDTPNYVGESNAAASMLRTLMKWVQLSDGTIPANAIIDSAVMSIYFTNDYSSNARTLRVYRPKRAWVSNQATWNIYSTGNSWATAGGFGADDCEQTGIGSINLTAAEALNEFKNIALTASKIQEYVSGAWTNNGFLLKMDTETDDMYAFAAIEDGTESHRPKLTITWHLPGGGTQVIII